MKILFTADWHIKLGQKNVPIDWQKNRYNMLYQKIYELQHKVDLIIIGGDIFDRIPTIEELELYFDFISGDIKTETILYDGNHEATKRGHSFLHKLKKATNYINKYCTIIDRPTTIHDIDFLPYTDLRSGMKQQSRLLCTHVRGEIKPHVKPEIDLNIFNSWETVLAGDLHSYENCQRNILYPGSPLSTSFHRSKIKNGLIIFDTDDFSHEFIDLKLPQLLRKTVESVDDVVETSYDHTVYEIVGDIVSLSSVDTDNTLVDKKVSKKESSSTLQLKNKTIEEEVALFLKEIKGLNDEDISNVLTTYRDMVATCGIDWL